MRRFLTLNLVVALLASFGSAVLADDGLFSDVPFNTVFAKPGAVPSPPGGQPVAPPVNPPAPASPGIGALAAAVKEAGFEPKQVSEQIVQTKVQFENWSFPILVTGDPKKQEVVVVLLLSVVKDEKQLSASKLLELLDASRQHAPAFFAYSSKRKRIELYRTLEEPSPTAETLKTEINRLASVAKATESLWNLAAATAQQPATTSSLAGKWSAAKSTKEAFALLLAADGKYTLVHVSQGKQNKSTGTYTVANGKLTLAGSDGTKLAGTISAASQQQFVFTPSGSGKAVPLTFKRAT